MKPLTEKDKIFLKEEDKVCIPYFELQRQLDEARVLGSVQGWNSALKEVLIIINDNWCDKQLKQEVHKMMGTIYNEIEELQVKKQ